MTASYHRQPDKANRALLLKFALIAAIMFGFGYLLVPLYDQICKATGLRDIDTPDEIENTQIDATRTVRIELDANVNKLPWRFRSETPIVTVHPGELLNLLMTWAEDAQVRDMILVDNPARLFGF